MKTLLNMCIDVAIDKLLSQVTSETIIGEHVLTVYESRRRQLAQTFVRAISSYNEYVIGHHSTIRVSELQAARSFLRRI